MNRFKHVLNTWLLSHVIHPFLFSLFMLVIGDRLSFEAVPILVLASPLASIPALGLSWMLLNCLPFRYNLPVVTEGLWLLLVAIAIFLNLFILLLLAGRVERLVEIAPYMLPAVVSSWVAILVRTKQFQHLFTYKTFDNENSLV